MANPAVATAGFDAAPDWVAPLVQSMVIAKPVGYLTGSIHEAGTYYVYAAVTDSGNPPSGVAEERADVTTITIGGSAVTLVAGSYAVGGAAYTHRSALLTASSTLTTGPHTFTVRSTDTAGNTRTQTGSVLVDNTAPAATDVQAANHVGGIAGHAEQGDTISFVYSEQIDPQSIRTGWTGSATDVVVRIIDGGCTFVLLTNVCADDSLVVYDATNATQLPLGTVDLKRSDYHGTGSGTSAPLTFGAAGTRSTMVQVGATITITFGTASATAPTAGGSADMVWAPSTASFDAAGNPLLSIQVSEGGVDDREF